MLKKKSHKEGSPLKGFETQRKKAAEDLWKAYFKNPLENVNLSATKKTNGQSTQKLTENIRRLK